MSLQLSVKINTPHYALIRRTVSKTISSATKLIVLQEWCDLSWNTFERYSSFCFFYSKLIFEENLVSISSKLLTIFI